MKFPSSLTTVTPLSKILALFLFFLFPIVGFFLGMQYQALVTEPTAESVLIPTTLIRKLTPTPHLSNQPYPTLSNNQNETANWKTYKNEMFKIEFKYPNQWNIVKENNPDIKNAEALEVEWKTDNNISFSLEGNPRPVNIVMGHLMGDKKVIGDIQYYAVNIGDKDGFSNWLYYTGKGNSITPTFKIGYLITNKEQLLQIIDQILSTFKFSN